MTAPLHFETLLPSLLETTISAFKNGAKDIANNLLMNLIFTLKEQNNELKEQIFRLEKEPTLAVSLDNDDFHDSMIFVEDMLEKLLHHSMPYRDKSDLFMELYKVCDEMFGNTIVFVNEVSAVASEIRYTESKLAS